MSIDLVDIADWIASITTFQKGTTLQVNHFSPTAPDRCIMIANNTGGTYEPGCGKIDYLLSVYSRSTDWRQAQDDQLTLFNIITKRSHIRIPGFRIEQIINFTYPQQYGRDKKDRFVFYAVYKLHIFID